MAASIRDGAFRPLLALAALCCALLALGCSHDSPSAGSAASGGSGGAVGGGCIPSEADGVVDDSCGVRHRCRDAELRRDA